MKRFIYAVVFAITMGSISAMAQDENRAKKSDKRPDRTEMMKKRTERMAERYGLDEGQTAKLLALNTEYMGNMPSMGRLPRVKRGGGNRDRNVAPAERPERPSKEQMEEMRKKMAENRAKYEAGLKEIMTPEQYAKYEQDKKDMSSRAGNGRNRGRNR